MDYIEGDHNIEITREIRINTDNHTGEYMKCNQ